MTSGPMVGWLPLSRASPLPQGNAVKCGSGLAREGGRTATTRAGTNRIQNRCFMTAANVYQQRPTSGANAESSLHHADLASLVGKGRKNAGVTVRETQTPRPPDHPWRWPRCREFAAGVHKALGIELPGSAELSSSIGETMSLQWMGPDEWLLIVPTGGQEFAAEQKLREALEASCTSRSSTSAVASKSCWN
jgi:hypothetical protein